MRDEHRGIEEERGKHGSLYEPGHRIVSASSRRPFQVRTVDRDSPWILSFRRSYRFIPDRERKREPRRGDRSDRTIVILSRSRLDIRADRAAADFVPRPDCKPKISDLSARAVENRKEPANLARGDVPTEVFLCTWLISLLFVRPFVYAAIQPFRSPGRAGFARGRGKERDGNRGWRMLR